MASKETIDPKEVTIIGLDTKDGPEHPLYQDRIHLPITPEFVANIDTFGVKQNVLLWRQEGKLIVVFGRQRTRAARVVNEDRIAKGMAPLKIPYIVARGDIKDMVSYMTLENEARVDDTPKVKGMQAQRMLDMGFSVEEIATRYACSPQTINNYLKLLEATPEIQAAVESGTISATKGVAASRLPKEEQVTIAKAGKGPRKNSKLTRKIKKAIRDQSKNKNLTITVRAMLEWSIGELDNKALAEVLEIK